MPDITIFLSRQKSAFVKTARTENGLFLLRFVEDDTGIPGVFQGGRNGISAKKSFRRQAMPNTEKQAENEQNK